MNNLWLWLGIESLIVLTLIILFVSGRHQRFFTIGLISFFVLSAHLAYHHWGAADSIAHANALKGMDRHISEKIKEPNLTRESLLTFLADVEQQMAYSEFALGRLGYLYLDMGEYDRAIDAFEKAIKLNRQQPEYQIQWVYAHSLKEGGKLNEQLRMIAHMVLKKNPNEMIIVNLLAIDDFFQGRYNEAIDGWQRVLRDDQNLSETQRQRINDAINTAQKKQG